MCKIGFVQFLRLGFDGYKKIMVNLMQVAAHLAKGILDTGVTANLIPSMSSVWHHLDMCHNGSFNICTFCVSV